MRDSGQDREAIAATMTDFLGEEIGKNALDAYASEARDTHTITVVRFLALARATGAAQKLLQLLADKFDLAVIDNRYLPAIEAEILTDKIDELKIRQATARRAWKGGSR